MRSALAPQVKLHEVWAWSMYDFANSGYTTVVITAVFGAYFVSVVAQDAPWATFAWTAALSVSYAAILVTGPLIGAWADARAGDEDGRVGDRQGSRPRERGPGSILGYFRNKISAEHGGNDDGGVAGVGEVIHAPRPDFMQFDLRCQRGAHGAF